MPSATDSKSIFDTLFGCCLGSRGQSLSSASRGNEHGDASIGRNGHGVDDERTPLIGGRGRQINGIADTGSKAETSGQGRRSSTEQGVDKRAISRKRIADTAKLRSIRDQANDAFFYIDNSQLLPSSSSSRPYTGPGGSKRDVKGDATLHQDLVAESDKAERLYKAALATLSEDADNLALSPEERESPLSLVRQMKVTIRDATNKKSLASTLPNRKPSSSPQEAHARMGLDVSEDREGDGHYQTINKMSSLHSLRTLRLGPTNTSFGSNSMESEKMSPKNIASGDAEDEDWSQRGRTRSKRGLAWMDVGQSDDVQQQQQQHLSKPNLHEIFQEQKEPNHETAAMVRVDAEEVPNALRLSSKQTDTMRNIQEKLKASSSIAELWDSHQDNN